MANRKEKAPLTFARRSGATNPRLEPVVVGENLYQLDDYSKVPQLLVTTKRGWRAHDWVLLGGCVGLFQSLRFGGFKTFAKCPPDLWLMVDELRRQGLKVMVRKIVLFGTTYHHLWLLERVVDAWEVGT